MVLMAIDHVRVYSGLPAGGPSPGIFFTRLPALLAFLNTTKYPASLSFLLMTLGPIVALIPALENARGSLYQWMKTFGRVPFFFYLMHIPLIHAGAILVSLIRLGEVSPWLFGNPPAPDGYTWSLGLLYATWILVLVILYVVCRWFEELKARGTSWWLRYL